MVTKQLYKTYSTQIAKLFCKDQVNKVLCEAGIAERLNTYLDDSTYPIFLSKLGSGRMYITNLEAFQNKGFRIVLTDLITGEYATAWWTVPYNLPYYSQLKSKLESHKYYIISANKNFDGTNRSDIRITWNSVKPSYEITFVPYVPPGGGGSYVPPGGGGSYVPPGGGGSYVPPGGGGLIIQKPKPDPLLPGSGSAPAFDLQGILDFLTNPVVLIIGGVVIFYLIKK